MRSHAQEHSIAAMSRVLSVTRQGYYAWCRRAPSARARVDAQLLVEICAIHTRSRRSYGSRRVRRHLMREGYCVGRHRVARLMAAGGLRTKRTPRFRVTTDSRNTRVVHNNILGRDFAVGTPNRAWAGDITYLWTPEQWLYLAVVMDVGSRRVIGWSFRESLETELASSALDMALGARTVTAGLICHSDRGSQYAAAAIQTMIARYQMRGSMSRKGNCWDNAVVESFFAILKTELVSDSRWHNRADAISAVVSWIEGWYNRGRLHSTLGHMSPVEFEEQIAQTQ